MEAYKCFIPACRSKVIYICSYLSSDNFFCARHFNYHLKDCNNEHRSLHEIIAILEMLLDAKAKLEKKKLEIQEISIEPDKWDYNGPKEIDKGIENINKIFKSVLRANNVANLEIIIWDMMKKIQNIREKCMNYCWVYFKINLYLKKLNKKIPEISIQVEKELEIIRKNNFYELKNDYGKIMQELQRKFQSYQMEIGNINEINRLSILNNSLKSKYEEWNKIYKKATDYLEQLQTESIYIDWLEMCISKLKVAQRFWVLEISESSKNNIFCQIESVQKNLFSILVKDIWKAYKTNKIKWIDSEIDQCKFLVNGNITKSIILNIFLSTNKICHMYDKYSSRKRKYRSIWGESNSSFTEKACFKEIFTNLQFMSLLKSPNNKLTAENFLYHENCIYLLDLHLKKNKKELKFTYKLDLVKNTITKYKQFIKIEANSWALFNESIISCILNKRKIVKFDLSIDSWSVIPYANSRFHKSRFIVSYCSRAYIFEIHGSIFECEENNEYIWSEIGKMPLECYCLKYSVYNDGEFYFKIRDPDWCAYDCIEGKVQQNKKSHWYKFDMKKKCMIKF